MKLLIITQKVDVNDSILGFFHRWIEEFAKHYEQITVICLEKGKYNLSANVKILSLGKEEYTHYSYVIRKLVSLYRFYKYILEERKSYDAVFVHMNQEYVLLGWKFWKLWNKKIYLWRNHAKGDLWTHLAVFFSHKVFYTSSQSFTARFKKSKQMPVGIDIDFFKPATTSVKKPNSILFLGRIAPVKKVEIFIEALNELQGLGVKFSATIAGSSLPKDAEYEKMIKNKVVKTKLDKKVKFIGPVTQEQALQLYREHELYVNLTPSGSMDKTIFEAMACEIMILTSNQALQILSEGQSFFPGNNPIDLAKRLSAILHWSETKKINEGGEARSKIKTTHDLQLLMRKIKEELFYA